MGSFISKGGGKENMVGCYNFYLVSLSFVKVDSSNNNFFLCFPGRPLGVTTTLQHYKFTTSTSQSVLDDILVGSAGCEKTETEIKTN